MHLCVVVCWCSAGEELQGADDVEIWEAGESGDSPGAVGEQDAGGAQAAEIPQRIGRR